jgi:hypothetical protein
MTKREVAPDSNLEAFISYLVLCSVDFISVKMWTEGTNIWALMGHIFLGSEARIG